MADEFKPDTLGVRAGGLRSDFLEHSEALTLTTSFVYRSAAEAARRFANEEPGNIYSRFTNPTVTMFQSRLAALEGAEACVATATGMAAVATLTLGLLKTGDHLICARGVFGTVVPLFDQILAKLGISTTWVSLNDLDQWRKAVTPKTKLFFVETPSNPVCEVADVAALAAIAKQPVRSSPSTTPCARPRCKGRSSSAPTSWCIRPPSTSKGRGACSRAPSAGAGTS